ncbi:hypothetical protein [Asticcacaulis machinosus]|uniref:beta-xylosidase family glycoside hydrolase n=1 Tax=Asticcacaulis machinosus TaxID=2984211 RepID=UPI0034A0EE14
MPHRLDHGGEDWNALGEGRFNLIASEPAKVWTGMYLGMFAVSSAASPTPADVDSLSYISS